MVIFLASTMVLSFLALLLCLFAGQDGMKITSTLGIVLWISTLICITEYNNAKLACEKSLPRDQKCVVMYVPETVEENN